MSNFSLETLSSSKVDAINASQPDQSDPVESVKAPAPTVDADARKLLAELSGAFVASNTVSTAALTDIATRLKRVEDYLGFPSA